MNKQTGELAVAVGTGSSFIHLIIIQREVAEKPKSKQ